MCRAEERAGTTRRLALGESALPSAEALARRTGASLTLVREARVSLSFGDPAADRQRTITQAEDYLAAFRDALVTRGLSAQTSVPFGGTAASWTVEEIGLQHADLVVMATHGRVGPDRWIHGSVAEAVVKRATAPVMLVRAAPVQPVAQHFDDSKPVLVVQLDGSEMAEAALTPALKLGQAIAARVVLIARLVSGALDALTRESVAEVLSRGSHAEGQTIDIEAVVSALHALSSREQRSARELHDLVSCEQELGDDATCLLLDSIACDSDKHVRTVNSLAHRLDVNGEARASAPATRRCSLSQIRNVCGSKRPCSFEIAAGGARSGFSV